ncbi:YlbF family regulator [bacterium]|nr:YlbF family regulator [bacterium]MDY3021371.1 YlbF family regulator [Oliverpabstia sp.]
MDRIQMCVDSLIEAVKEGETYQRYLNCEEKLKAEPELRQKIDEFRVAVFHLHNDESNGDLYEKIDQFENEYEDFRKNPIVNEYLEAELDVCKLMQRISNRIQIGVDIQIPQV